MKLVNNETETISDAELRALRDRVFERPSTDPNWEYVKNNWRKPASLQWLNEKSEQPI